MIRFLGGVINDKINSLAEIMTKEMGKPILQSYKEVEKVISFCNYYSENYEKLYPVNIKSNAKKKTLIRYEPLGTIYNMVPFNFPFFLNFKGGLPNLLLGNCLLVRNPDSTPMLGQAIE